MKVKLILQVVFKKNKVSSSTWDKLKVWLHWTTADEVTFTG